MYQLIDNFRMPIRWSTAVDLQMQLIPVLPREYQEAHRDLCFPAA